MSQTTIDPDGEKRIEFFKGKDLQEVKQKMDTRLSELIGHKLVGRKPIMPDDSCHCGSGFKFKDCCLWKVK